MTKTKKSESRVKRHAKILEFIIGKHKIQKCVGEGIEHANSWSHVGNIIFQMKTCHNRRLLSIDPEMLTNK